MASSDCVLRRTWRGGGRGLEQKLDCAGKGMKGGDGEVGASGVDKRVIQVDPDGDRSSSMMAKAMIMGRVNGSGQ